MNLFFVSYMLLSIACDDGIAYYMMNSMLCYDILYCATLD